VSARDVLWAALWDNYTGAEKEMFIDEFAAELASDILNASMGATGDAEAAIRYAAEVINPEHRVTEECPWCWGSHGCSLQAGHEGDHVCDHRPVSFDTPETRPRGHADLFHWKTDEAEAQS
jgi:hypothetical protein